MVSAYVMALSGMHASHHLFYQILKNTLHMSLSSFTETPIGRIMNYFSEDIAEIDYVLPFTIRSFFNALITGVFTVLVIVSNVPWLLAILPLVILLFFFVQVTLLTTITYMLY